MKSLHLCNLANVAYGNCRILEESGYDVELRCHDLLHVMSQPEWYDLELCAEEFPNEDDFTQNSADFGSYHRPDWFHSGPLSGEINALYSMAEQLLPSQTNELLKSPLQRAAVYRRSFIHRLRRILPARVRRVLKRNYYRSIAWRDRAFPFLSPTDSHDWFTQLMRMSHQFGPEWALTWEMFAEYGLHAMWLDRHLTDHDITFAYVLTPIYALLRGNAPFISVEIGTMRDIPFEQSGCGKLLAMAYRLSDHVLITNPDVKQQAERLGLTRYSFCPHPVDEEVFVLNDSETPLRRELRERHQADYLFFAPARQNWEVKGNDKYLKAFARLRADGVRAALIIPGWGQEVARSQELCRDLGIKADVTWLKPMSERVMAQYFHACDLVLDQFQLGVFGLITCKALSCGKPVLTSYDESIHAWCFREHPPVIRCDSDWSIYKEMSALCRSHEARRTIGHTARDWILKHHSKRVVREAMESAMALALEHFNGTPRPKPTLRPAA